MSPDDDPRWRRLDGGAYRCACRGNGFAGVFALTLDAPGPWPHERLRGNADDPVFVGQDYLTGDRCRLADHRHAGGLVELPIVGTASRFAFSAWASVSSDNFARYGADLGSGDATALEGCFGWLSNDFPTYGIGAFLHANVWFHGSGRLPTLVVFDDRSQLGTDQERGITFDRLLDIPAASGIDVRPDLMDA